MNRCDKCGLPFYGEAGQKVCGDCRVKKRPEGRRADIGNGGEKKPGFWRRIFGRKG